MTLSLERMGLQRGPGRVLAYLMVATPPEQTMNDLMDALQMSKSSISTATQMLVHYKLIDRVSLPGERRDYYRMREGAWMNILASRVEELRLMREIAEEGLALLNRLPDQSTVRMQEMVDYMRFMESELPAQVKRWEAWLAEQRKTNRT
jgi:DNA-binding transcriptional regulator GbsR (MarR family)